MRSALLIGGDIGRSVWAKAKASFETSSIHAVRHFDPCIDLAQAGSQDSLVQQIRQARPTALTLVADLEDPFFQSFAALLAGCLEDLQPLPVRAVLLAPATIGPVHPAIARLIAKISFCTWVQRGDKGTETALSAAAAALTAQAVPEIEDWLFRHLPLRSVRAVVIPLGSGTPRKNAATSPGTAESRESFFFSSAEAVEILIAGVLEELDYLQETLTSRRYMEESEAVARSIGVVEAWARGAAEGSTSDSIWSPLLALVSRGFEAAAKLRLTLDRQRSENLFPSFDDLLGFFNENFNGGRNGFDRITEERVLRELSDLAGSALKNLKFGVLRGIWEPTDNRLVSACETLRALITKPLFRARTAEAFARYLWNQPNAAPAPASAPPNGPGELERLRQRVRDQIVAGAGWSAILAIPPDWRTSPIPKELAHWLEGWTGQPCVILDIQSSPGWLYLEKSQECPSADAPEPRSEPPTGPTPSDTPCWRCGNGGPRFGGVSFGSSRPKSGPPLICPECGRFNSSDWWICENHGKTAEIIPIDKVRCPECILRHHRDPVQYPASSISVRPGYAEPFPCPFCEELYHRRGDHPIFFLDEDLIPFYRNGVNGHDRARFLEVSRRRQLIDGYRCPHCATILVPVDHRHLGSN